MEIARGLDDIGKSPLSPLENSGSEAEHSYGNQRGPREIWQRRHWSRRQQRRAEADDRRGQRVDEIEQALVTLRDLRHVVRDQARVQHEWNQDGHDMLN